MHPRMPIKLADCEIQGPDSDSELFLVEGDSAAQAVINARDSRTQAVLPMQGKPLNANKASRALVARNEWLQALVDAIGAGWGDSFELDKARYNRVLLMMDPDADGIHCGALMLMFFYRWMRPLLETGRISAIRPPVYEISSPDFPDRVHAFSDSHYKKLCDSLNEKQIKFNGQRYRGLASINASVLVTTCIDPATRHVSPLSCDDALSAIQIFGGKFEH
jgi:DNA gyrase subunit B